MIWKVPSVIKGSHPTVLMMLSFHIRYFLVVDRHTKVDQFHSLSFYNRNEIPYDMYLLFIATLSGAALTIAHVSYLTSV